MTFSDPRTQAVIVRFLLVLAVTDAPIVSAALLAPTFDWRFLLAGLITGAAAAAEKLASPQLATVILPGATVMPNSGAGPGVPLAMSQAPVAPPPA